MSKININLADLETLTQLNGIGDALATRIVTYRETVHLFEEVIELTAVPGISERMVRQFEDQVTLIEQPEIDGRSADFNETDEAMEAETTETPIFNIGTEDESSTVEEDDDDDAEEEIEEMSVTIEDNTRDEETAVIPDGGNLETIDLLSETVVSGDNAEEGTVEPATEAEKPEESSSFSPPEPAEQIEEREPIMTDELASTERTSTEPISPRLPEPPPMTATEEPIARRRGCLFVILGTVAGAILGASLTLAILAGLNGGTLRFADAQLERQLNDTNQSIEDMAANLDQTNENLSGIATRTGGVADELETAVSDIEQSLDNTQKDVTAAEAGIEELGETAVALDNRIDGVSTAAETFTQFLDGMRDLLLELQGEPTSTRTPSPVTPTATDQPNQPTRTPRSSTPASTRIPTRTPRPTSTPLALPTPTPAQQP